MNKKGITLIELIIFIIVGGMFIPLAYIVFTSVVNNSMKPETAAMARVIAEGKINNIVKNGFECACTGTISNPAGACQIQTNKYDCILGDSPGGYVNVTGYSEPSYGNYKWKWEVTNVAYTNSSGNTKVEIPPTWIALNPTQYQYRPSDYVKPIGSVTPYNHFYRVYFPQWQSSTISYTVNDFVRIANGTFYRRLLPDTWNQSPPTPYAVGIYVRSPANAAYYYRLTSNNCLVPSTYNSATWPPNPGTGDSVSELRQDPSPCTLTWTEGTAGHGNIPSTIDPASCGGTTPCDFTDGFRWQQTDPSLLSGASNVFSSYTNPGDEFNDGDVRWKESTVYRQIKVYVLPPGCSGGSCEYIVTTLVTDRNYTPGTGRP
jgi:hypothetical protein